ncbi:hypothetical protein DFO77_12934 [Marinilabilia salmonicolor]|jgi:hypothetical protein|uniref:Uncharacterized protein n=1 Tax=Marinilabilia salmonicolor TaxID=989 RepID=A0A2T0XNQ3_9BACT|nr:hypothetical protein BY457_105100 [Marinilabilia salmonicolor]RCW29310.1 hypothetical protein DFO77_12934 [Marinilabilia salmonicolor]
MGVFVFQHDKVSDQKQDKKQILFSLCLWIGTTYLSLI